MYQIKLAKRAVKDSEKIAKTNLETKVKNLVNILKDNPYQNPPPFEKLVGDLKGCYSRRINIQHRLVYSIHEDDKIIVIRSMWSHYE